MTRFIDTNVLVRLLTNDIPDQAHQAVEWIKESQSEELAVFDGVLVELFFVLEKHAAYAFPRSVTAALFQKLLTLPQLKISPEEHQAYAYFEAEPKLDFMDCLLAAASGGEVTRVLTFDKRLRKTLNSFDHR